MSETRRVLRIEPYRLAGGEFAVWLDDELKAVGTRAEAEEAIGRWQADLDAGKEPDWYIGGLVIDGEARAEVEALRAEIEKWRRERDPSVTGGRRRTPRREDEPDWRPFARNRIRTAPDAVRNLKWLTVHGVSVRRTVVMKFLSDLRDEGLLPPPRDKRK
jgi:hypothetical protein